MKIGSLWIEIFGDTSKLDKSMTDTERRAEAFGRAIGVTLKRMAQAVAVAVTAAATAVAALTVKSFKSVDALAKMSDRLGIATDELQALRHAAALTGVQTNQLDIGLQRMTRRIAEASQGTGEAQAALKELGLDAKALASLPLEQQFQAVAEAMQGVEGQSQRVRLAFKLFDSEGVALVNTLRLGKQGLQDAKRELEALGVTVSRIDASKIEAANDAMTRIGQVFVGLGNQIAVRLAPLIEHVATWLTEAAKASGGFGGAIDTAVNLGIRVFSFLERQIYSTRVELDSLIGEVLDLFDTLAGAPPRLLAKIFGGTAEDFGFEAVNKEFGKLKDTLKEPPSLEEWETWWQELQAKATAAAEQAAKNREAILGGDGEGGPSPALLKQQEELRAKLTALQESLLSEREAELNSYAVRMADLQDFYRQGLLTKQEYNAAALDAEKRHAEAIKKLDDEVAKSAQRSARERARAIDDIAGNITAALGRAFGESKAWAIAEAIINTAQAVTKTLAQYGATPWGIAAAAAAAAAGAAQIATIRSTNRGGGGSVPSVSASAPTATQAAPAGGATGGLSQTLFIQGISPGSIFTGDAVRQLVESLIDYQRDGGKIVLAPA